VSDRADLRDWGTAMNDHGLMIRPFRSTAEMLEVHEAMFGALGRFCAEAVLQHAQLFEGLDPLTFRVMLAPVELGPYGRHIGYAHVTSSPKAPRYILANRFVCQWRGDNIGLARERDHQFMIDFLVHEMTHHRQVMIAGGMRGKRGDHRDPGWWGAISEAAPHYLGISFPSSIWPKQKPQPGRITEVEATHWPHSFRKLIAEGDPRLHSVSSVVDTAALREPAA
jgi:hypothetical protein